MSKQTVREYQQAYFKGYQDAMKDCTAAYMRGGADALILWVQDNDISLRKEEAKS